MRDDLAVIVTRIALVALAAAACAWFAVLVHDGHDQREAARVVSSRTIPTTAQAARARRLLDSAGALNPDTQLDVLRAQLAIRLDRKAEAERILLGAVAREPENVNAWYLLEVATFRRDPALNRRALARVWHLARPRPRHH